MPMVANAILRHFQDAIFSREHTYVKTLTKIIFDLLQWQEIATLSLPKKAAIASFISTTFRGHFCLGANDIARNRSRGFFSRACADIFRRWSPPPSHLFLIFHFFCLSLSICFSSLLRARNRQITRLLENSLLIRKLSLNQLPHHYFLFISQKPVDHHVPWGLPW